MKALIGSRKVSPSLFILLSMIATGQSAFASSSGSCANDPAKCQRATPIVGGVEAGPGEFPFMVSFRIAFHGHFCGGSLVAKGWVLTAAHCLQSGSDGVTVHIGLHDLNGADDDGVEHFMPARIIVHPDYNAKTHDYDFALVKLDHESTHTPVALEQQDISIPESENTAPLATIAGWGSAEENGTDLSQMLMKAEVPLVSQTRCIETYPNQITGRMICAGFASGGHDTCQGDSGGPLIVYSIRGDAPLLAGVVSWGNGCAEPGNYGVYAKVSSVTSWIAAQIH